MLFFIIPNCFNAKTSSSGSAHLVLAKLHKRVHAVLVPFFLKNFAFVFLKSLKTLKHCNCLSYNELYCRNNSRKFSQTAVYTGLIISPSGISELDCATTKINTAERSISIRRESLKNFLVLGALAYFEFPPLGGSREEKWRSQ